MDDSTIESDFIYIIMPTVWKVRVRPIAIAQHFFFEKLCFNTYYQPYFRAQMQNMGMRPYTNWVLRQRAKSLSSKYPQYDRKIIEAYGKCNLLYGVREK